MPRPARIEYEGAFHHVMNRGRQRQTIFRDEDDYQLFLNTLSEASKNYNAVIHAYCLMSNHYHCLIETPKANLSQIMKHVNGLYTQRYNRKHKKDGTLFRGRYKSVLVDEDAYLLQLTRYIHRNPLEVKKKIVQELSDYPWSSYPAYINQSKPEDWLFRDKTYQMLGHHHRYKGYLNNVEKGVDEDTKRFYSKGNLL
jgi:putative transposase